MTTILHRGLRNCFLYAPLTFSNFSMYFYFLFQVLKFLFNYFSINFYLQFFFNSFSIRSQSNFGFFPIFFTRIRYAPSIFIQYSTPAGPWHIITSFMDYPQSPSPNVPAGCGYRSPSGGLNVRRLLWIWLRRRSRGHKGPFINFK